MKESFTDHKRGFTLIEILVVIAILAVLAGILLPTLRNAMLKAKISGIRQELSNLALAIESYAIDKGEYPENCMENSAWTSELYPWYIKQLIDNGDLTEKAGREYKDPFAPRHWDKRRHFYSYCRMDKDKKGQGIPSTDSFVVFSVGPDEHGFLMVDQNTGEINKEQKEYIAHIFNPQFMDMNHDGINDFDYSGIGLVPGSVAGLPAICARESMPNNPGNPKVIEIINKIAGEYCSRCDGIILHCAP